MAKCATDNKSKLVQHIDNCEMRLARLLAGNCKRARAKALKSLSRWFRHRCTTTPFTEADLMRIWTALFYTMWMSDKPLVQEKCATDIARLVHKLDAKTGLLYFKCGIRILLSQWFGIDQHRLDKYQMLVRRLLREQLLAFRSSDWNSDLIGGFTSILDATIFSTVATPCAGLFMHFTEIYMEEMAKCIEGSTTTTQKLSVQQFLMPFIRTVAYQRDMRLVEHVRHHIFTYLMRQSAVGQSYDDKYNAWKALGFPGSIEQMQRCNENDDVEEEEEKEEDVTCDHHIVEEGEEKIWDPRAGRVDVVLPQIVFDARALAAVLVEHQRMPSVPSKNRHLLQLIARQMKKLSTGDYPLKAGPVAHLECYSSRREEIEKAAQRLRRFEEDLFEDSNRRQGRKRRRKVADKSTAQKKRKKTPAAAAAQPTTTTTTTTAAVVCNKRGKTTPTTTTIETTDNHNNTASNVNTIDATTQQQQQKKKKNTEDDEEEGDGGRCGRRQLQLKRKRAAAAADNGGKQLKKATLRSEKRKQLKLMLSEAESLMKQPRPTPTNVLTTSMSTSTPTPTSLVAVVATNNNKNDKSTVVGAAHAPTLTQRRTRDKHVTIDTSLNRSQDVRHHLESVKSSPQIPYDANRQPKRPLLKRTTNANVLVVNPFYRTGQRNNVI